MEPDLPNSSISQLYKKLCVVSPPDIKRIGVDTTLHDTTEAQMKRYKFNKSTFVMVNLGVATNYRVATKGTLVWVTQTYDDFLSIQGHSPFEKPKEMFGGIPLADDNYSGRMVWYPVDDFTLATDEQIEARLTEVKKAKEFLEEKKWKIGDCVQLNRDLEVERGSGFFFFMSQKATIRKGSLAIVDTSTGKYDAGDEYLDPNRGHAEVEVDSRCPIAELDLGKYKLSDFVIPLVVLYFPESESEENVPCTYIESRVYTLEKATLVLPKGYLDKVMRVINRVVNRKVCEDIYLKLGLWQVCQKGRGALILLYGPPGTGKTMTAEVIADRLKRPLIRVSLRMFEGKITERLKAAFIRAQKYNAILLLDEVDVFIRKRGDNPLFDEHTAIFLKSLEYYDGIMFMTTNLIDTIDPAVFSRIHVCLGFETSEEDRSAIWRSLLTPELLKQVSGTSEDHEEMIKKLSEININGREIKTVIQNAVSHAVYELGDSSLPESTRWISRNYFLNEAKSLQEQRDELKKGSF
jgi:hypothetical protein